MPAKLKGKPKKRVTPKTRKDLHEKAKKTKKKTQMVYLPAIIPKRPEDEAPGEAELSYKEALIAAQIEKYAAQGLNNDQIIAALGVARSTFYNWIREKEYFQYCLMKHRELANIEVEAALFKNCVGFDYYEQQATQSGKVVSVQKRKLPETKAQEFYLTNRRSADWKKKVETTHEIGPSLGSIVFAIKRYEE